jgi:hypothetical protein
MQMPGQMICEKLYRFVDGGHAQHIVIIHHYRWASQPSHIAKERREQCRRPHGKLARPIIVLRSVSGAVG